MKNEMTSKKQISGLFLCITAVTLLSSCGNKDQSAGTGANNGVLPQPLPPVIVPQNLPPVSNKIVTTADVYFDNSVLGSQFKMGQPIISRTFRMSNYDQLLVPNAPTVKLDGTNWVPFDPQIHTFFFTGLGKNLKVTNDAVEILFQFDEQASLSASSRVNQTVYKGSNIPYHFEPQTGFIKISHFYLASAPDSKSSVSVALHFRSLAKEKVSIDWSSGSKTPAIGADLVDLSKSVSAGAEKVNVVSLNSPTSAFLIASAMSVEALAIPQTVPPVIVSSSVDAHSQSNGSLPQAPAAGAQAAPIKIETRVYKSNQGFTLIDRRVVPGISILSQVN
jgi:hypothetical protein